MKNISRRLIPFLDQHLFKHKDKDTRMLYTCTYPTTQATLHAIRKEDLHYTRKFTLHMLIREEGDVYSKNMPQDSKNTKGEGSPIKTLHPSRHPLTSSTSKTLHLGFHAINDKGALLHHVHPYLKSYHPFFSISYHIL